MNKIKNQIKGITLIALVVTIIVLLILAGIAINLTIGDNGLFTRAENATVAWNEASKKEENELASFESTYDNILNDMNKITLASKAKPGDYVKYTVLEKNFTFTKEQTGYEVPQTYNAGDYKGEWQVLYNDAEHGLRLVSTNDVTNGTKLYITGKNGYTRACETFDDFCSNYVNTEFATRGRCLGGDYEKYNYLEGTDDMEALERATSQSDEGLLNRRRMLDKPNENAIDNKFYIYFFKSQNAGMS